MGHVFSGETQAIDKSRFGKKWYPDLDEDRIEWEELLESRSMKGFLKNLKVIPLYQYITNYLYYWFYKKDPVNTMESEVLDELIQKVAGEFKKNQMPKDKCKESHIREILTTEWSREWDNFENASTERIFELALGLNLPAEDVEELLEKAVKRAGFNYYDKEELLTYCVIRYQKKARYECLQALLRDWDKIEKVEEEFIDIRENTMAVRNDLEENMDGTIYKDDDFKFEKLNEGLKFFFGKCKAEIVTQRTAARAFQELYETVTENYEEDILAFKNVYRGTEELASTKLEILYDAASEIKIPEGTIFYAEKNTKKSGKYIVEFVNREEKVLPKLDGIEVVIPIVSCESHEIEKDKKKMPCYIKKEEKLILKTLAKQSESKESQALLNGLKEIVTNTTVKYTGKIGAKAFAAGDLKVKADPGIVIPEGTVFLYNGHEYKSTEEVTIEAKAEIEVVCTTPHQAGEEITKTNTINHMRKMIPGILKVSNPKPVKMREATNTISKELFREFLYGHNADDLDVAEEAVIEKLLGRWFTETEITSVRFTKIQKQIDTNKRNAIEKNEVRRSDIITLVFLKFCKEVQEDDYDGSASGLKAVYQDFVRDVNKYLRKCRMMPFYLTNPYERFLAYLLKTDSPVDSLRNAWMIVNAGRRDMDV